MIGRTPPNSEVLKQGIRMFRGCAAKVEAGRGNPDCTFEHVTAVFGVRLPSRDAQLHGIAPKVRTLLERQYPQLATAQLADGSKVKYNEWRKQAARDRAELKRLRKEHERTKRKLEQAEGELDGARAVIGSLREGREAEREKARTDARAEQEKALADLRATMELERTENERRLHRRQIEHERLLENMEALSAERDALERALFTSDEDEHDLPHATGAEELAGWRVLLVGGHEGQIPPIREHLESLGVQLLHDDSPAAAELVAGVHAVAFWIRFMSHATSDALKRECRAREVPMVFWTRASPASLVALLAEARRGSSAGVAKGRDRREEEGAA